MKKIILLIRNATGMFFGNGMYITYQKCRQVPEKYPTQSVKAMAKRYRASGDKESINSLLSQTAVKDNIYFLEKECGGAIGKGIRSILDVGCGNGAYSAVLGRKGSIFSQAKYTGVEIDKNIIEICRKHY